jgi:hypothetical protein
LRLADVAAAFFTSETALRWWRFVGIGEWHGSHRVRDLAPEVFAADLTRMLGRLPKTA